MSSLKLSEDRVADAVSVEGWVTIESPTRDRSLPAPSGVVLSLAALRKRYARGENISVTIDIDEVEYGGGDAEISTDLEVDMEHRWDQ